METKEEKWKIVPRYSDIRSNGLVEAICEHGIGHHRGVHGCDKCCFDWPKDIEKQTTLEN